MPKLMFVCRNVKRTLDKLRKIVERDGGDAFYSDNIFAVASDMLEQLTKDEEIVPVRQTRADVAANPNNNYSIFHGYIVKGSVEDAIATCHSKLINILLNLKTTLTVLMEPLLGNLVFKSTEMIPDSESYQFLGAGVLYDKVKIVADHFKSMFMANGCSTEHLKEEFKILHNHIKRYVSKNTPMKC